MTPTQRYFQHLETGPLTREEWQEIARAIVAEFEQFLEQPIVVEEYRFDLESKVQAFAADIASQNPCGGPLEVSWSGCVYSATYAATEQSAEQPFVVSELFIRSVGKRVITTNGLDFVQCQFEPNESGSGTWSNLDWVDDEFEEYEQVE